MERQLIHAFNDNKIIQFKNFDLVDNKIKQFNDDFEFFYISKSSFLNQHETIDLIFDKKLSDEVHDTLLSQDFKEFNHEEFSSFKIKNVIPYGHNEINLSFNPLELNLIHLVDFEKGCYVGQENTARIKLKNKLSKRLLPIKLIDGKLEEDEKIYNNNVEIGKVLIDGSYPFALIKYLDKNFIKDKMIKSKNASFKIFIPEWLQINT